MIKDEYLLIYTDASYYYRINIVAIAFVIKNKNEKIKFASGKIIKIGNSNEAELRAINKAISYINDKQAKELIQRCVKIKLFNDNEGVVNSVKNLKNVGKVKKDIMNGFYKNWDLINKNNDVEFEWINRAENKHAHELCNNIYKEYIDKIDIKEVKNVKTL